MQFVLTVNRARFLVILTLYQFRECCSYQLCLRQSNELHVTLNNNHSISTYKSFHINMSIQIFCTHPFNTLVSYQKDNLSYVTKICKSLLKCIMDYFLIPVYKILISNIFINPSTIISVRIGMKKKFRNML